MTPFEYAVTQIGTKEIPLKSNNIRYNTWYYGKRVAGSEYPWCAVFCAYCFNETHNSKLLTGLDNAASVYYWAMWAKQKGIFKSAKTKPKQGWLVCFSWSKDKSTYDHIGFVKSNLSDTQIETIEGNTSDAVRERVRDKANVIGYIALSVKDTAAKKNIETIAKEVINGNWGNGADRKKKLTAAGYSYNKVQKKVNELLKSGKY